MQTAVWPSAIRNVAFVEHYLVAETKTVSPQDGECHGHLRVTNHSARRHPMRHDMTSARSLGLGRGSHGSLRLWVTADFMTRIPHAAISALRSVFQRSNSTQTRECPLGLASLASRAHFVCNTDCQNSDRSSRAVLPMSWRCGASTGKVLFGCLLVQLANLVDSCLQDPLILRRLIRLAR